MPQGAWAAEPPTESAVTPREALTAAEAAFGRQDFERVRLILEPYLTKLKGERRADRLRALELYGGCSLLEDKREAAKSAFSDLLKEKLGYRLNAQDWTQAVYSYFETVRSVVKEFVEPPKPKIQTIIRRSRVLIETRVDETPTIAYLMPFGVGQFANKQTTKGVLLAVFQGIGIITSVATWFAAEGFVDSSTGQVASSDVSKVELLRAMNWAGLGIFVASWGYSIVDGLLERGPGSFTEERIETLPDEIIPAEANSIRFGISPLEGGAGFSLGGRF